MFLSLRRRHGRFTLDAKAALDSLNGRVMVADADFIIRYMNPSVTALLREAEAELRQGLPDFSVDKLVGSSIDAFHKDPSHQRRMLGTLAAPHAATIAIGSRTFDLRVVPLSDASGRRRGYVVEWADAKERLLNLDYSAQIEAISRSQSMIVFTAEGVVLDANTNFLDVMGYTINEIRGQHHGMFVEPGYRDSTEYRDFLAGLRDGKLTSGQFKRIAKGGRQVWIAGVYNPIFDAQGKVVKIVKLASDVTAQVRLLADLKTIIDQNFGEIDGALVQSSAEAQSAASAAEATSGKVNSVAASAEQLAASVSEIAENMSRSATATEGAFEQTVGIGQNTEKLAQAAQAMGRIVDLIRGVASQINLLALNATIEAARAGDAGKGFAVVASEVKGLAIQVARATEQISTEIEGMQSTSSAVIERLAAIRDSVTTVRDSVTAAASAVEEQSVVTRGISAEMQGASGAVTTVSSNIGGISAAVTQVAQAVAKTKQAASVLVR